MYKFEDLKWKTHPIMQGEITRIFFGNGYGCSVWCSTGTHVDYELAVIVGEDGDWKICYDTPITDDVVGYIPRERVEELLNEVAALPPA